MPFIITRRLSVKNYHALIATSVPIINKKTFLYIIFDNVLFHLTFDIILKYRLSSFFSLFVYSFQVPRLWLPVCTIYYVSCMTIWCVTAVLYPNPKGNKVFGICILKYSQSVGLQASPSNQQDDRVRESKFG